MTLSGAIHCGFLHMNADMLVSIFAEIRRAFIQLPINIFPMAIPVIFSLSVFHCSFCILLSTAYWSSILSTSV